MTNALTAIADIGIWTIIIAFSFSLFVAVLFVSWWLLGEHRRHVSIAREIDAFLDRALGASSDEKAAAMQLYPTSRRSISAAQKRAPARYQPPGA